MFFWKKRSASPSPQELYRQVQRKLNQPDSPFVQGNDMSGGEVWMTSFNPSGNTGVMAFSLVLGGTEGFTLQWNYTLTQSYRAELGKSLREYLGELFDQVPQIH